MRKTHKFGYMAVGMVVAALIMVSVPALASTARRNVSGLQGGVSVVVDGQRLNLSAADEPVVIDGRTFLPVRALADATGLGIGWDGATSTVSIATGGVTPTQPTEPPERSGVVGFDTLRPFNIGNTTHQSATLSWGIPANFVVRGAPLSINPNAMRATVNRDWVRHNVHADFALNGNYTRLTATAALSDASMSGAIINISFFGDNILLGTFNPSTGNPVDIDIPLDGVQTLRINIERGRDGFQSSTAFPAIYNARFYPAS